MPCHFYRLTVQFFDGFNTGSIFSDCQQLGAQDNNSRKTNMAAGRCREDTGSADNTEMRSDRSPPGLPIACDGTGMRTPAPTDLPTSPLPAPRPVRLLSGEQLCPHFFSSRLGRVSSCQAEAHEHVGRRQETGDPPPRAPRCWAGPGTPSPMRMGSIPGPPPPAAASRSQLVKAAATTTTETPFKL